MLKVQLLALSMTIFNKKFIKQSSLYQFSDIGQLVFGSCPTTGWYLSIQKPDQSKFQTLTVCTYNNLKIIQQVYGIQNSVDFSDTLCVYKPNSQKFGFQTFTLVELAMIYAISRIALGCCIDSYA